MFMIRFFKDFWLGLQSCYLGVKFVFKHNLWPFFIFSAVVAGLVLYLGVWNSEDVLNYEVEKGQSLIDLTIDVAIWLGKLLMLVMAISLNKYIVLMLLPPVLVKVSERTETILTGNKYKFNLRHFWDDIKRSVKIVINNFAWEAGFLIVGMIVFTIVGAPPMIKLIYGFLVGLYFYGFSMMDYTLERMRLSVEDSKRFIRKHAGFAVGLGFVYSSMILFLTIKFEWFIEEGPGIMDEIKLYFGVIFAPIICVTAATLGIHKLVDLRTNEHAIRAYIDNDDDEGIGQEQEGTHLEEDEEEQTEE